MTLILYRDKKFKPESLVKICRAIEIIEEYDRQGFVLTLRQLYYQFVARDLIPNTQREYAKLSVLISDARLAGLISWDSIEDRTQRRTNSIRKKRATSRGWKLLKNFTNSPKVESYQMHILCAPQTAVRYELLYVR